MVKKSLQIKIITFLMVAVPIIIVSYVFIWENAGQRKTAEIEKNVSITTAFAQLIEKNLYDRRNTLINISHMLKLAEGRYATLEEILNSLKTQADENYYITDLHGQVLVASNYSRDKLPVIESNNLYYKQALQGKPVFTPLEISPFSGENVITIFTPVFSDNTNGTSKVVGIIAGELPISYFKRTLDLAVIGKNGKMALADNKGNYVYGKDIDNKTKPVVSNCYFEAQGRDQAVIERQSLGTKEINVFTMVRLKNFGWYAITVQPSADITNPGLIVLTKNVVILLLILAIIFIFWRYKVSLEHRNLLVEQQRAEKLALVGELAAGMAHEIRNPLTAVKGFIQILKGRDKYSEDKEILDLISGSVDHIEGIVRETLLLAKPQKIRETNIQLTKLVTETCKFMRTEAVLKGISLELQSVDTPINVLGDEIHIKQVLVNIIKNAIEASADNGQIHISLEQTQRNSALIGVRDNGKGISPKELEKIGTPFFTTKASGTGLGLSVSKRIIEEHRGNFRIKSKVGKGTKVMIELPLAKIEG
ncbi:MAG: ATP-binding protein [Thermincola sp.]|jgi:signal transduction histidine kinase|nr:ATP-binding protein [Thermincola sp.]MDT3704478.1 ATP-binding protein [Thermincola sp.]